jgi:hypothetical protein
MLTHLLLLTLASFGCSRIINPRQNFNVSSDSDETITRTLTRTITSTNSNLASASSCMNAKYAWARDNGTRLDYTTVVIASDTFAQIDNLVDYKTTTSLDKNATAYTLCDKWPRLDGTTSVIASSYPSIYNWTSSFIRTESISTAYPAPNCTILKPECDILHNSWSSASSVYSAAIAVWYTAKIGQGVTTPASPTSPICGSPTPFTTHVTLGPPACAVNQATVQLLYWPAARQSKDLCNNNASLSTMGPTIPGKPNTAVYGGTTLTSPTVYIAVDGTWRVENDGTTSEGHASVIIAQNSTDVSSVCGNLKGGYNTYAVNYADFAGNVPADAYRCQPRCNTNTFTQKWYNVSTVYTGFTLGNVTVPESTLTFHRYTWNDTIDGLPTENLCSTIWDDYRPALSIPAAFASMNPAQNMSDTIECEFVFGDDSIFYDPPKALGQRDTIIKPTMPATTLADPISTAMPTPDPGSTPKPTTASATQLPIVETDPPAVSDQASQSPEPGTGSSDVPVKPSQSPNPGTDKPDAPSDHPQSSDPATDKPNVPGQSSQLPDPATDGPHASNDPSQSPDSGAGASNAPGPSSQTPDKSPGPINTASNSHPTDDPGQATTGPAATASGSANNSQVDAAPVGVVITATDGQHITAIQTQPAGPIVVGSVTLTQGQSTKIDGVGQVVAGSSGLSVDSSFHTFTVVGPVNGGAVAAGSTSVAIGALIMAGLGDIAAGTEVAIADGTSRAFTLDPAPTNSAYVVADITFTAHATSAISLDPSATLVPGGPAVSYASHVVSMPSSGAYVVVDGTTQQAVPVEATAPIFEIGGTTYTADRASGIVVEGATLTRGGAITADDTTISLASSGGFVVVNGATQSVSTPATTATTTAESSAGGSATESSADESATESSASESATESTSASASTSGPALASSADSIAISHPWLNALIVVLGICFLL